MIWELVLLQGMNGLVWGLIVALIALGLSISLIVIFAPSAHLVRHFYFLSTKQPKFSIADFV